MRLYNCAIYGDLAFAENSYPDFLFYNCYVENPYVSSGGFSETTTAFVNCVINWNSGIFYSYILGRNTMHSEHVFNLNFYNCIFNWTSSSYGGSNGSYILPNTATCYNCLSINKSTLFNNLVSGGNNKTIDEAEAVFTTYRNGHNEGETFELIPTAKATYKGTDGTEIGMQGGKYPYTTTVQYPIITKFGSDSQTNKQGKLNIEVEVDGK